MPALSKEFRGGLRQVHRLSQNITLFAEYHEAAPKSDFGSPKWAAGSGESGRDLTRIER
jgi:hypothetical protein